MLKEILFALQLAVRVIGIFAICILIGMKCDTYFQTSPWLLLVGICIAFIEVMKIILGVLKHE